jgi:hypothetical protein
MFWRKAGMAAKTPEARASFFSNTQDFWAMPKFMVSSMHVMAAVSAVAICANATRRPTPCLSAPSHVQLPPAWKDVVLGTDVAELMAPVGHLDLFRAHLLMKHARDEEEAGMAYGEILVCPHASYMPCATAVSLRGGELYTDIPGGLAHVLQQQSTPDQSSGY